MELRTDKKEGGGTGRMTVGHLSGLDGHGADAAASNTKPASLSSHTRP